MNAETRAVVEAVLEAIDIPHAATSGGSIVRDQILAVRLMETIPALRAIAKGAPIGYWTAHLSAQLNPALDYVTVEQARDRVADGATWAEAVTPGGAGP